MCFIHLQWNHGIVKNSCLMSKKKKTPHFNVLASSSQNQSCVSPSEIDLRIKGWDSVQNSKPLLLRWMFKIHQKSCPSQRTHKLGRDFSLLSLFDHRIGGNFYLGTFEMSKVFCFSQSNKAKAKPVWWCAFPSVRSGQCTKYQLSSLVLL